MKKILLVLVLAVLFGNGCGKENKTVDPAAAEAMKQPVKCSSCRVESPLGEFKRVSQILARCPKCQKVINIMEARFGKKKSAGPNRGR